MREGVSRALGTRPGAGRSWGPGAQMSRLPWAVATQTQGPIDCTEHTDAARHRRRIGDRPRRQPAHHGPEVHRRPANALAWANRPRPHVGAAHP
jgi:hypothetical protein